MKLSAHEKMMVAARFQAAGIPFPAAGHSVIGPDLLVESLKGSRVFDLKLGSECVLNVRISNNSYGDLRADKLGGHLLEADWPWTFQGDPREHDQERKTYRMPSGRYLPHKSVLNHRLRDDIAPGTSVEGKLLAFSFTKKIPQDYLHGLLVPLEIVITDQYGRQHPSTIEALVDRTATMSKPKAFSRIGRGLDEGCPAENTQIRPRGYDAASVTGKADTEENGGNLPELTKRIIDLLGRADLDAMLTEETSTRDEEEVNAAGPRRI